MQTNNNTHTYIHKTHPRHTHNQQTNNNKHHKHVCAHKNTLFTSIDATRGLGNNVKNAQYKRNALVVAVEGRAAGSHGPEGRRLAQRRVDQRDCMVSCSLVPCYGHIPRLCPGYRIGDFHFRTTGFSYSPDGAAPFANQRAGEPGCHRNDNLALLSA